jgi:hypothetical protein
MLLSISVLSYNQTLDGFYGFKFGLTYDSIKKAMLAKPGCKIDKENTTKNVLSFKGVSFANRDVQYISFEFTSDQFYIGTVAFKAASDFKIVNLYNDIQSELNAKYYKTTKVTETYNSPYKKGDNQTETAIKLGKTNFSSYWYFKNPKSTRKDVQNSIWLNISYKMLVKIVYQDGVLYQQAQELLKKKNIQDY